MRIYNHIGVAVTMSPRLPALLAESARMAARLGANLSLINIGDDTTDEEFRNLLRGKGLPADIPIHRGKGSPAGAIMEIAEREGVDLLIAGAQEKERALRYFLGSVARTLVRESESSLILFTEPEPEPGPIRRIVVITDFSEMSMIAMRKALYLASKEPVEGIDVVRVHSTYGEVMALSKGPDQREVADYIDRTEAEEKDLLRDFIDAAGYSSVDVRPVYLEGNAGVVAAKYAHQTGADLLVMPSERAHASILERIFPSDMEWVLREIPCNLWVVREKSE